MRKEWIVKQFTPEIFELSKNYKLNPIIVQILISRKVKKEDFSSFLNPSLDDLFSPFLLPDIDKAVRRIKKAVEKKEKVFLFGDYDVDGITSLVIFYEYIKDFSLDVSFYIPHRIEEGYGLNEEAIRNINEKKTDLIICFDCGTNSKREVELANSLGMDVIAIDHHIPQEGLNNDFCAFVNPKRQDSSYPFKDLSAAAISFKLVWALKGTPCFELLDLVALSTVCDVVPLKGENRVFVKEGIECLRNGQRPAIEVLCKLARVKSQNIEPYHIGYILGPRINACGRVSRAMEALDLFLSYDRSYLKELANRIDGYNKLRRGIERRIFKEAETIIECKLKDDSVLVVYKEGWHPGVLGIVASKLVDKYGRPAFVLSLDKERGKGSARSVQGFHILEALHSCSDFLASYGGHKKAAGIEILKEDIEDFRERLNKISREKLKNEKVIPRLYLDWELQFEDITMDLIEMIEKLKPFGEENRPPLFVTKKVLSKTSPKKINGSMYSFWISDGRCTYEAKFYERDGFLDMINYGKPLNIVYSLEKNYYYNAPRIVVKDLRLH